MIKEGKKKQKNIPNCADARRWQREEKQISFTRALIVWSESKKKKLQLSAALLRQQKKTVTCDVEIDLPTSTCDERGKVREEKTNWQVVK